MVVTIVTMGSEGDVRPYVALGLSLTKEGYEVRLASTENYREFVSSFHLEFISLSCQGSVISGGFFNSRTIEAIKSSGEIMEGFLAELWRACQGTDSIIYNATAYPCLYIAEKLGIPCFAALMQPYHPTCAFPHPFVTDGVSRNARFNRISFSYFSVLQWLYVRKHINRWRQETLSLHRLKVTENLQRQLKKRKPLVMYGFSPLLLPPPSDWPKENIHVTGYWFLDSLQKWEPPDELAAFLLSGPPPVYLSRIWNTDELSAQVVKQIVEEVGCRVVLQGYEGEHEPQLNNDNVYFIKGDIPHEWLFPRMKAVVHHGGLGTTMNSLRAGVPMVAIPDNGINDQLFWSLQISRSGLGSFVRISYKDNEKALATKIILAIKQVMNDSSIRLRVEEMAKKIRNENGTAEVVKIFRQVLSKS